jgi:hypothetical protein
MGRSPNPPTFLVAIKRAWIVCGLTWRTRASAAPLMPGSSTREVSTCNGAMVTPTGRKRSSNRSRKTILKRTASCRVAVALSRVASSVSPYRLMAVQITAVQITMRFTIHLRGPRKRHIRRCCFISVGAAFPMVDFDANWLTFASQLALSVDEPSSRIVDALLF